MKILLLTVFFFTCHGNLLSSSNKTGRIVGGSVATEGEFPFVVAIYLSTEQSRFFCQGALLDQLWILTAGHCVKDAQFATIYLGTASLQNANTLKVATGEFRTHPEYNAVTLENDIGLIRMRQAVTFTDYIQPISLTQRQLQPYSLVKAIGWGQIDDEHPAPMNDLRVAELAILSDEECKKIYGNWIVGHMMCVAGDYNEGTCRGDSGAPLIQLLNGFIPVHVGVSSFISRNGCLTTEPSGFTNTYHYLDWIKEVTNIG